MPELRRTKMKGKIPTVNVMTKLIIRAARALSRPFPKETRMDRNMNNALTSSAKPTLRDMTFRFTVDAGYRDWSPFRISTVRAWVRRLDFDPSKRMISRVQRRVMVTVG